MFLRSLALLGFIPPSAGTVSAARTAFARSLSFFISQVTCQCTPVDILIPHLHQDNGVPLSDIESFNILNDYSNSVCSVEFILRLSRVRVSLNAFNASGYHQALATIASVQNCLRTQHISSHVLLDMLRKPLSPA